MNSQEQEYRLDRMALERMRGATFRSIASRYGLSKSQAHRLLRHVEKLPPPPRYRGEIVPLPDGEHVCSAVAC